MSLNSNHILPIHIITLLMLVIFCFVLFLPNDCKPSNSFYCQWSCLLPSFIYIFQFLCVAFTAAQTFLSSLCFILSMFALSAPAILKNFQPFWKCHAYSTLWIFLQLIFLLGILLNFVCVCVYVVSSSFYICFHVNSSRESCVTHTFSLCLNKIWVRHPSSVLL